MLELKRFALNRILSPGLGLKDFYTLAAGLGLSKVELRNDLPGPGILDGLGPAEAAKLAESEGVKVISINALQKFNLKSLRDQTVAELEKLLELAGAIACPAVVLCPNNDPEDRRDQQTRAAETAEALEAFGPLFEGAGIMGYVEPLGFAESSLSSRAAAVQAIHASGCKCYRIVHDTFHYALGKEAGAAFNESYDAALTGLVHVSAVEEDLPPERCRDPHRLLPSATDRLRGRDQIRAIARLGYKGDFSLEPFAAQVQSLAQPQLLSALRRSLEYLRE